MITIHVTNKVCRNEAKNSFLNIFKLDFIIKLRLDYWKPFELKKKFKPTHEGRAYWKTLIHTY